MYKVLAWFGLSGVLLISGCFSGLHSNQPAQQEFVLSLQSPPTPAAPAAPGAAPSPADTLLVLMPSSAPGLSGASIAVLRSQGQLDFYNGAHWAIDAPVMLQSLVIEALRRRGRFALVESDSGAFDARYVLSIDITQFQADYSGSAPPTARVALFCTLGRRADRSAVTTLTVSAAVSARADRMAEVIAAFQRATNEVLTELAEELAPPAPSAAPVPAVPPVR